MVKSNGTGPTEWQLAYSLRGSFFAAGGCGRMDNFNPKKRYNQFRQARRKKNKFAVAEINTDEATGRHFKLERFLKDCVIHLPKQGVEPAESEVAAIDDEPAATAPKPRRSKHIKLPVLNECKGIFENVIIGRSAKKGENFVGVGATPEDRARLEEDIHALAKVGPDSELSFEMIPPTQQQQESVNVLPKGQENNNQQIVQAKSSSPIEESSSLEVVIHPVPVGEEMQIEYDNQNREYPEDPNRSHSHQNSGIEEEKTGNMDGNYTDGFYQPDIMCNGNFTDSSFKDSPIVNLRKAEGKPKEAASYHCECCRKTASRKGSFFDTETILKSNEARRRDRLAVNEIFSNREDPGEEAVEGSWLFEVTSGGPSNFLGSTYPPPGPSDFDFKGIGIQSVGRHQREVPANHGVDYCGRRRPAVSLKRRSRRMDLNKEANHLTDDFMSTRNLSTEFVLHHLSPYNKYRYDRSLSPRRY